MSLSLPSLSLISPDGFLFRFSFYTFDSWLASAFFESIFSAGLDGGGRPGLGLLSFFASLSFLSIEGYSFEFGFDYFFSSKMR